MRFSASNGPAGLLLLAGSAVAVDVAFMQGEQCNDQPLFGIKDLTAVTCYDVSGYDKAGSVDVRNFHVDQAIRFFSDNQCSSELESTSDDLCYTASNIAAFTVTNYTGPGQVRIQDTTTDLAVSDVKMSNYETMAVAPFNTDLRYSNFFIGVSAIATASGLSFAAGVIGCYSAVSSPTALNIYGCIAGPIGTILGYVGYYFLARAGQHAQDAIALASGTIQTNGNHNVKRDMIDSANFQYMHSAMNVTGNPAVHSGLVMKRDLGYGEQSSPIYELVGADGQNYHVSAFFDENSGSFMHHLAPVQNVQKRQNVGYNNVRWSSGGMDFSFCNRNANADRSVYNQDINSLYNTAYNDLGCLVSQSDLENNQQLLVDMYNDNSVLVGETHIAPYKEGGPVNNNQYVITRCSSMLGHMDQSCIN